MNRIVLLFLSISLLSFSSCNRQEFYSNRLNGKWIYERACYQEKTFKRVDILDQYRDLDVYFTADGAVEIFNTKDSTYYEGLYEIDEDNNSNANPDGTANSSIDLIISYEDTTSGKNYLEVWDQANIRKKKIRFERIIDGRRGFFTLRKQLD